MVKKNKAEDIKFFWLSIKGTLIGFLNLFLIILLTWVAKNFISYCDLDNDVIVTSLNWISGIFGGINLLLALSYPTVDLIKITWSKIKNG